MLGLSPTKTTHAIGLAATQVTGLREMFGSHCKSFHVGRAAQNGPLAAVMAEGGYTSSEGALEAKRGWAAVVGTDKSDVLQNLDRWLGTDAFPMRDCRSSSHRRLYPIARGTNEGGTQPSADRICHGTSPPSCPGTHREKTPKDGLEAKFSVYHSGACGLLLSKATLSE
ncbi:immune-responsive 1 protein [Fusarium denticulatum]|uniref:Immune-responsive 1 protein n=1 Tax=Fusarium denticulatum TaxID=48507 RepID=A0A8H5SWT6_9HYPO|nr:immune-responsive 1 protein [Fusarium denticulatum]